LEQLPQSTGVSSSVATLSNLYLPDLAERHINTRAPTKLSHTLLAAMVGAKRRNATQQQRPAPPQGSKRRKRGKKSDVYEADDSDPEEDKHKDRYDVSCGPGKTISLSVRSPVSPPPAHPTFRTPSQRVENYEYELPSDFEDEEIDEEMAFTAEDKERYAGWFDDAGGGGAARGGGRSQQRGGGNFADLESSEEEPGDDDDEDGELDDEVRFWLFRFQGALDPAAAAAPAACCFRRVCPSSPTCPSNTC